VTYTFTYTGEGRVHSIHDSATGRTRYFTYDSLGRLIHYTERDARGIVQTSHAVYDDAGRLIYFTYHNP